MNKLRYYYFLIPLAVVFSVLFGVMFWLQPRAMLPGGPAAYVNPFMGTENGGNMFPGVTMPFGVVKIGVDLRPPPGQGDPYSGYHPSGKVTGFSMMHESGTGGAPKYGVVSQMPVAGDVENPLADWALPREREDTAALGWYKSSLKGGITVELTAGRHSGIMRHSFPNDAKGKHVLVDVSHFLPSSRGIGIEQNYVEGGIKLHDDGRYSGYGVYNGGWNYGIDWKIFFCGKFSAPHSAAAFEGTGENLESFGEKQEISGRKRVGALFSFAPGSSSRVMGRSGAKFVVESRIGISWISPEKACGFIDSEIPDSESFEQVVDSVQETWNREVFARVAVRENDESKLRLLYTSIYGMFLIPSDRTGENPGCNSTEPYYDDIFTLWDTFRSHTPLFHILQPQRYVDFLRSLVDTWRHDGWLPDGRSSNYNGRVQGGSNADNVLADARVKGVTGVNWDAAYAAMLTNAEEVPPNNHDAQSNRDSSTREGRGALPDWLERGFITRKYSRSVSRAVEYAANDFAVAQVARSLGTLDDTEKYLNRSRNWRNHWDARMSVYGFSGFLSPIEPSGSFPATPHNPLSCGGCYWSDPYYQALPFEYSFSAHHDMRTLISLCGGDRAFVARLDKLFSPGANPAGDKRFGKTIFNPGNEPSFASPYLYNFVPGSQWRSVARSRQVSRDYFNSGKKGLPGNSDAGAMQSWLLWALIGLYPITGTTTFLVGSPQISYLAIDLGQGRTFEVKARGADEEGGGWFVQSLKVNGRLWDRSWVEWDDVFKHGGTMEFSLGKEKVEWDTGERPLWGVV